jgi:hypothetical protein
MTWTVIWVKEIGDKKLRVTELKIFRELQSKKWNLEKALADEITRRRIVFALEIDQIASKKNFS